MYMTYKLNINIIFKIVLLDCIVTFELKHIRYKFKTF